MREPQLPRGATWGAAPQSQGNVRDLCIRRKSSTKLILQPSWLLQMGTSSYRCRFRGKRRNSPNQLRRAEPNPTVARSNWHGCANSSFRPSRCSSSCLRSDLSHSPTMSQPSTHNSVFPRARSSPSCRMPRNVGTSRSRRRPFASTRELGGMQSRSSSTIARNTRTLWLPSLPSTPIWNRRTRRLSRNRVHWNRRKPALKVNWPRSTAVSYTHLRAHETRHDLVCRLLLEKKKKKKQ